MISYSVIGALVLLVVGVFVYLAGVRHGLDQGEAAITELRTATKRLIGELTERQIGVIRQTERELHHVYQMELEHQMAAFVATYTAPAEPWK